MKRISHPTTSPRDLARRLVTTLLLTAALLTLPACGKVYYGTWEALGVPKRDIMVDRVQSARDDQEAAKEQFASALEKFSAMFEFEGGELEAKYKALKAELERMVVQCAGGKIADCRVIEVLGDHSLCATDHRHPETEETP